MNKKYTFPIGKEMVTARSTKRISTISAVAVCRKINRMDFKKAKDLVGGLLEKSKNIGGKYYTKTAEGIMEVLKSVENNAANRGFEPEQMRLRISAHQGPARLRSRRKRSFGVKLKISHVHAVLEKKPERKKDAKKEEKAENKKEDMKEEVKG